MLQTHLRCKMSTEANARCFSSLTGHTCAVVKHNANSQSQVCSLHKNVKNVDNFCDDCHFS